MNKPLGRFHPLDMRHTHMCRVDLFLFFIFDSTHVPLLIDLLINLMVLHQPGNLLKSINYKHKLIYFIFKIY